MAAALPPLFVDPWLAAAALWAGAGLDRALGEPRRGHPLVAFGRWTSALEHLFARLGRTRLCGSLAWIAAVVPWVGIALWLRDFGPLAALMVDGSLLYFALGGRSLAEHGRAVAQPLAMNDLPGARERVGWMVSRDTAELDAEGVARAATESVLENGNDAVFGALFWFLVAGGPGALAFRLANTLDAMWGYRTPAYHAFGWAAARADDGANWLPARLTALTYALLGRTRQALRCWHSQAPAWDSPNAGPVMAAGAGALGVRLGGAARYHGESTIRPALGEGRAPDVTTITAAISLVGRGQALWLILATILAIALGVTHA
ncbi:MAG: cobalamin biosynthesis protein [Zoogloeaceae bacterium]|nr:cobalamin biosynthesis protein [Zoogloeaceae bacterium]